MPKKAVIDPLGDLRTVDGVRFNVRREPDRWVEWLRQGQPFRFQGLHVDGHAVNLYSVRAKLIKGYRFWYAERKQQGRTRTVYIGKDNAVTLDRLRWAFATLRQGAPPSKQRTVEPLSEPAVALYSEERARAVEA